MTADIMNESAATHSEWFRMFVNMAVSLPARRLRRLSSYRLRPFGETAGRARPAVTQRRLVAAPIALDHEADRRIRIGAEILAGGVEHVVLGVGAVPLLRQRARSGANDQNEGNGCLGEHGRLLSRGAHNFPVCVPI